MTANVSRSDSSSNYYIPVWNELSGTYQVITGVFQRQCAAWQESNFGTGHPRPLVVMEMKREGKENITEGLEKLRRRLLPKLALDVISLVQMRRRDLKSKGNPLPKINS